jgi:ADP-ribose pyrophosphatase
MDLPELLSSTVVYQGRLFDVNLDELRMPNGVVTRRENLLHPGAVCMVPIAQSGDLLLVTQYRHSAGRRLLEVPAGTLERGEDPRHAAIRELQEEVGMFPHRVEPLGGLYVAPGYTTEYIHIFVCTDLEPRRLAADADEDLEVFPTSPPEALAKIESGEIADAKSIVSILRWARVVGR